MAIIGVVPGVHSFLSYSMCGKLLLDNGRVVSPALGADALQAGKSRPLAAVALNHNALRTPPVDRAELDLLNLIVSSGALDSVHRRSPPLPSPALKSRLTNFPPPF